MSTDLIQVTKEFPAKFRIPHMRWHSLLPAVCCRVKHPLFINEVLVHEASRSVGTARLTYYPIDGFLKNILIGLELRDGSKRQFPLVDLRRASPEEEATLEFVQED
jgi:hypothetical protein